MNNACRWIWSQTRLARGKPYTDSEGFYAIRKYKDIVENARRTSDKTNEQIAGDVSKAIRDAITVEFGPFVQQAETLLRRHGLDPRFCRIRNKKDLADAREFLSLKGVAIPQIPVFALSGEPFVGHTYVLRYLNAYFPEKAEAASPSAPKVMQYQTSRKPRNPVELLRDIRPDMLQMAAKAYIDSLPDGHPDFLLAATLLRLPRIPGYKGSKELAPALQESSRILLDLAGRPDFQRPLPNEARPLSPVSRLNHMMTDFVARLLSFVRARLPEALRPPRTAPAATSTDWAIPDSAPQGGAR